MSAAFCCRNGLFLSVSVPHSMLQARYSLSLSRRMSGIRLNILPLRSQANMREVYLSLRNSILSMRLKV